MYDVIVIGGGQSGLAAGYHLQKKGFRYLILDANKEIGGSWIQYYHSLKLFSPARYSTLPGMNFPGDPDGYPTRNEVIQYLRRYAAKFEIPVRLDSRVAAVNRNADGVFSVTTDEGNTFRTNGVIAASGPFNHPYLPQMDGMQSFTGTILHSYHYKNPEPYRGQRVVVVGAGNSAVQIAADLAPVSTVTLATRLPVKFKSQKTRGKDVHFWLRVTGLDTLPLGYWNKVPKPTSVIDSGGYQSALLNGLFEQKKMFLSFTETGVVWADGMKEDIDTVVFATGYSPNYPYLTELGALNEDGEPIHRAGVGLSIPGLYYVGLPGQRAIASATLRGSGSDARYVIRKLQQYLKTVRKRGEVSHELTSSATK